MSCVHGLLCRLVTAMLEFFLLLEICLVANKHGFPLKSVIYEIQGVHCHLEKLHTDDK
jgi:hypothetical protein